MINSLNTFVERFYDNVSKMEGYNTLVADVLEKIKDHHPDLYKSFQTKLEEMLDGIYYEMVEHVLENINRKDGGKGIKWDYETAKEIIEDKKLLEKHPNLNSLEFWFALNQEYAIHANPHRTTEEYIDFAIDVVCYKDYDVSKFIKERFEKIKLENKVGE